MRPVKCFMFDSFLYESLKLPVGQQGLVEGLNICSDESVNSVGHHHVVKTMFQNHLKIFDNN